jgi:hypothetical protein
MCCSFYLCVYICVNKMSECLSFKRKVMQERNYVLECPYAKPWSINSNMRRKLIIRFQFWTTENINVTKGVPLGNKIYLNIQSSNENNYIVEIVKFFNLTNRPLCPSLWFSSSDNQFYQPPTDTSHTEALPNISLSPVYNVKCNKEHGPEEAMNISVMSALCILQASLPTSVKFFANSF